MKILIDATVMQQPATGIAKATLGLYNAALIQSPSLQISALHRRSLRCALPSGIKSQLCGKYLPAFAWRNLFLPLSLTYLNADIIHFPWNGNIPPRLANIKVATTLHDVLPLVIPSHFQSENAEKSYRNKMQRDIDRTDLLITISEYSRAEIIRNFNVKNEPVVIYHGPTLLHEHVGSKSAPTDDAGYFLYVGGYDARKGIEKLIASFRSLHENRKLRSKLILTGSKNYYSDSLKKLIQDGIQRGFLVEKGYVEDNELVSLITGAIALVYPSKYEGFGLPPLEAMALGCPVLTTKFTAIPEVCGDAALYADPDDDRQFAEGIIRLQDDNELRSELKVKGVKQAQKFSWANSAMRFLESLEKTCNNNRKVPGK